MGAQIKVEDLHVLLAGVAERASSGLPERAAAAIIRESSISNFAFGGRPRWKDLSPVTKKRRRGGGGRPLTDTGRLKNSISSRYDQRGAYVYTNVAYAPTHQFGAKQGQFAPRVPWGDIPARPFLAVQETDLKLIERRVAALLATGREE